MKKFTCSIPSLMKIALSVFFVAMILGSFTLVAETKSIICSENTSWVYENPHQEKDGKHYYIGFATNKKTLEEAEEAALQNAFLQVSKSMGVEVSNISYVYREKFFKRMVTSHKDLSKTKGATLAIKRYKIENSCPGNMNNLYNFAFKIVISEEEKQRLEIEAEGKTDWSFKVSGCSDRQAKEIRQIFRNVVDEKSLNWKLQSERPKKPESKRIPETAYFATVEADCDGEVMRVSVEYDSLIENINKIATPGSAKGSTLDTLRKDLLVKLGMASVSKTEELDTTTTESLSPEFLTLLSDAKNFEKKWRLNPEKAIILWQKVFDYGETQYRDKAQFEIDKIQRYVSWNSRLSSMEEKSYKNLKEILEKPSFNTEILCEQISKYIDSFGYLVGSKKIDELFDIIKDKKKRQEIRTTIFSSNAKSWQDACKLGDSSKCYILSMNNDRESNMWKEEACERDVEKACFDLYTAAKKNKKKKKASEYAEKSCNLGNKDACFNAATALFTWNNQYDKQKSCERFADLCINENMSNACHMLGWIFEQGSDKRAELFYNEACRLGDKEACIEACKLGIKEACSKR